MAATDAADTLAAALERARGAATIAEEARRPSTVEEAERTAALLYGRLREGGARPIAWKLGATDAAGQRKLATDRPFAAPVYDAMSAPLGSAVARGRLVAPLLEVEIGVDLTGPTPVLRPCVELADSRLPGWASALPEAVADFGLQGLMLIGDPCAPVEVFSATVWYDGNLLATGRRSFADARALAGIVEREQHAADGAAPPLLVATGSITPPLPLMPGRWHVEIDEVGTFGFVVTR